MKKLALISMIIVAATSARSQNIKPYDEAKYNKASQIVVSGDWQVASNENITTVTQNNIPVTVNHPFVLGIDKCGNLHIIDITSPTPVVSVADDRAILWGDPDMIRPATPKPILSVATK